MSMMQLETVIPVSSTAMNVHPFINVLLAVDDPPMYREMENKNEPKKTQLSSGEILLISVSIISMLTTPFAILETYKYDNSTCSDGVLLYNLSIYSGGIPFIMIIYTIVKQTNDTSRQVKISEFFWGVWQIALPLSLGFWVAGCTLLVQDRCISVLPVRVLFTITTCLTSFTMLIFLSWLIVMIVKVWKLIETNYVPVTRLLFPTIVK